MAKLIRKNVTLMEKDGIELDRSLTEKAMKKAYASSGKDGKKSLHLLLVKGVSDGK
jgi:hypothetical protein